MFKLGVVLAYFTIFFTTAMTDDFIAISYPDALLFKDSTEAVILKHIKYILRAIIGIDASVNGEFSALEIKNVFKMPKLAVLATIKLDKPANYSALGTIQKYPIEGRNPGDNLRGIIDFAAFKARQTYSNDTKDIEYARLESLLTKSGVPEGNTVGKELRNLIKSGNVEKITVDIKANNFVAVHFFNERSALEFGKLVETLQKLKALFKLIFFGVLTYGPDSSSPANQSTISITIDPVEFRQHNVAPAYDENYAIIFNIILWFMVGFSVSLLAVILSLINMDPGRDSITYRLTATRSKKDI